MMNANIPKIQRFAQFDKIKAYSKQSILLAIPVIISKRYTAIQDVGTAIHPSYVEGQLQGGAVQGIGWALNEEYYMLNNGSMANSSFLDYRMPTSLDLPKIDTILVEVPNPLHPYGVRGVGEVPICPPIPAIANAIKNAIDVRLYDTPMNAGRIIKSLS